MPNTESTLLKFTTVSSKITRMRLRLEVLSSGGFARSAAAGNFAFTASATAYACASGAAPVQFFNIVKPGTVYGDRLNGVDLRLGKIVKYGRTKTLVAVDIFNLTNSNAVDVYQQPYGPTILTPQSTYLNPLSITQARFFKISAQFDF